jgi:hypothetical protein
VITTRVTTVRVIELCFAALKLWAGRSVLY